MGRRVRISKGTRRARRRSGQGRREGPKGRIVPNQGGTGKGASSGKTNPVGLDRLHQPADGGEESRVRASVPQLIPLARRGSKDAGTSCRLIALRRLFQIKRGRNATGPRGLRGPVEGSSSASKLDHQCRCGRWWRAGSGGGKRRISLLLASKQSSWRCSAGASSSLRMWTVMLASSSICVISLRLRLFR